MRRFNLFTAGLASDPEPPGYGAGYARVTQELAGSELAVKLFELLPGQSVCPYHYEYVEEWLIVLEGRPTVRHPEGEDLVQAGDAICFPAGPEGAHKVTNNGPDPVRLIMFSSGREPSVAVYPDSDKIGVWPGRDEDQVIVPRKAKVDYWEGEPRGAPATEVRGAGP
jgi:uncharacterized cupin superfamily protein